MYYLVFGIIAIICICGLVGLRRGLFKTLFGFIALILSIFVAYYVNPYVTDYVVEKTEFSAAAEEKIYRKLQKDMEKKMKQSLRDAGMTDDLEKKAKEETAKMMEEQPDKATQMQMIDTLDLPSSVKMSFIENNNDDTYARLGVDNFYRYMAKYGARLIVNIGCFLAVFIALRLVLLLISLIIRLMIESDPVLSGVNKLGGFLVGIAAGVIIIWIFMVIAGLFFGSAFDEMIEGNVMLEKFNETNIIQKILMNV